MADLEDIGITSILDMSQDESIEHLRQIRLSRRTPVTTKRSKAAKAKKEKAKAPLKLSAEQAEKLLNALNIDTGEGVK